MIGKNGILLLSLLLAIGCQAKRVASAKSYSLNAVLSVTGVYESNCTKSMGSGASSYVQGTYSFSDLDGVPIVSETLTTYGDGDRDCLFPYSQMMTSATYSLEQAKAGTLLGLSYTSASMQPLSEQAAIEFRALDFCEYNNWQNKVSKDIFSKGCFTKTNAKWISEENPTSPGSQITLYSCAMGAPVNEKCSRMVLTKKP